MVLFDGGDLEHVLAITPGRTDSPTNSLILCHRGLFMWLPAPLIGSGNLPGVRAAHGATVICQHNNRTSQNLPALLYSGPAAASKCSRVAP